MKKLLLTLVTLILCLSLSSCCWHHRGPHGPGHHGPCGVQKTCMSDGQVPCMVKKPCEARTEKPCHRPCNVGGKVPGTMPCDQ